jgi:regulator of nucleoside diphosphate kinase
MNHNVVITAPDRQRLKQMIRELRTIGDPLRYYLDALEQRLKSARIVAHDEIEPDVFTLHSSALITGDSYRNQYSVQVVYADESDPAANKLSVLTPLGTRLLGSREGELLQWRSRFGVRTARLESILFQPEAAERNVTSNSKEHHHDRATS